MFLANSYGVIIEVESLTNWKSVSQCYRVLFCFSLLFRHSLRDFQFLHLTHLLEQFQASIHFLIVGVFFLSDHFHLDSSLTVRLSTPELAVLLLKIFDQHPENI